MIKFAHIRALLLVIVSNFAFTNSYALCLDNRHTSLEDEYRDSTMVLIGRVVAVRPVRDPNDPQGVSSYTYKVKPIDKLKGRMSNKVTLTMENSSSRFPLDLGEDYLLFIQRVEKGNLFIDSCGNSSKVSEAGDVISKIKAKEHK